MESNNLSPVRKVIKTIDSLIEIIDDAEKSDMLKDIRGLLIVAEVLERTCIEKAYFDGREDYKKGLTENKQPYEPAEYYESIFGAGK